MPHSRVPSMTASLRIPFASIARLALKTEKLGGTLATGADITCSDSAPLYIISAPKVVVTLADGTSNSLTDGTAYVLDDEEEEEPNAALFSKSDLTINGGGSLTVTANYKNGIQSKDGLYITGGMVTVDAANNGIKGKDCVVISGGTVTVTAGGDGIRATNDGDAGLGYVAIEGGNIDVTAGEDGIQAATNVYMSAGTVTVSSGGGSGNSSTAEGGTWGTWGGQRGGMMEQDGMQAMTQETESEGSAKGVKATVDITITGGTLTIDSSDDAIHSNGSVTIETGALALASGDDGIHADATLTINGGDILVSKSYEGIEGAVMTINGGTIRITASDDGINVAGGNDGSSVDGRPGQNEFQSSGNNFLYLNGGYIYINATGDGIDVNGSVYMTGGDVIVKSDHCSDTGRILVRDKRRGGGEHRIIVRRCDTDTEGSARHRALKVIHGKIKAVRRSFAAVMHISNQSVVDVLLSKTGDAGTGFHQASVVGPK